MHRDLWPIKQHLSLSWDFIRQLFTEAPLKSKGFALTAVGGLTNQRSMNKSVNV